MLNDKDFLKILKVIEQKSKCIAKHVACILVKDNNIISIGINGTRPGDINCNELFKKDGGFLYKKEGEITYYYCEDQEEHHKWSLLNEYHAEINALSRANKEGVSVEGATAYISYSPCFNCCKTLIAFGIKRIVFLNEYDDVSEVKEIVKKNNIEFLKFGGNLDD